MTTLFQPVLTAYYADEDRYEDEPSSTVYPTLEAAKQAASELLVDAYIDDLPELTVSDVTWTNNRGLVGQHAEGYFVTVRLDELQLRS